MFSAQAFQSVRFQTKVPARLLIRVKLSIRNVTFTVFKGVTAQTIIERGSRIPNPSLEPFHATIGVGALVELSQQPPNIGMNSPGICRVCGRKERFAQHEVREMNFGTKEAFTYLECILCGSLQIQIVPPDLARHYPPMYLASGQSSKVAAAASLRESVRRFVRRQRTAYLLNQNWNFVGWAAGNMRTDELEPHLRSLRPANVRKKTRILDVGCGPGYLLDRLRETGYEHLTGQDPFQQWTVPGVQVHRGMLNDLSGQFDLIMLHHSLEHTPDPLQVLTDLKRLTTPGGSLLVRVPVAASAAWLRYGVNWYQIDAPRHLTIPSGKGLEMLAQRAGLRVVRVAYDSDETQFLCSEQYCRGIPLKDARSYYHNPRQTLFSGAEIADARAQAQDANNNQAGDQACFYLRVIS